MHHFFRETPIVQNRQSNNNYCAVKTNRSLATFSFKINRVSDGAILQTVCDIKFIFSIKCRFRLISVSVCWLSCNRLLFLRGFLSNMFVKWFYICMEIANSFNQTALCSNQ